MPSPSKTRLARLLRALLDVAAIVSLVLLVAVLGLWVESYWTGRFVAASPLTPRFDSYGDLMGFQAVIDSGGLSVQRYHFPVRTARSPGQALHLRRWSFIAGSRRAQGYPALWRPGFWYRGIGYYERPPLAWQLILPLWLIALLLLPLPLWRGGRRWVRRRRARRRARLGLCPACGYDLRASPERCPECGEERQMHKPLSIQ